MWANSGWPTFTYILSIPQIPKWLKIIELSAKERWVRSVKQECISKLILFGEGSLKRALTEFTQHYHSERNHQGKDNVLLFPSLDGMKTATNGSVRCRARLGGLLRYYARAA